MKFSKKLFLELEKEKMMDKVKSTISTVKDVAIIITCVFVVEFIFECYTFMSLSL